MDNLTIKWKEAKQALGPPLQTAEQLIGIARESKKRILYSHYGTIAVLTITLIAISLLFSFAAPFKQLLSKIGIGFMIFGLLLRLIIEVFSSLKSKNIQLIDNATKTANDALIFYNFRKQIHGPVTISNVAFYIIGFYLLSPEFSEYISLQWMIVLDSSFIVIVIVLTRQIRKGVQKEMRNLSRMVELKNEMTKA